MRGGRGRGSGNYGRGGGFPSYGGGAPGPGRSSYLDRGGGAPGLADSEVQLDDRDILMKEEMRRESLARRNIGSNSPVYVGLMPSRASC